MIDLQSVRSAHRKFLAAHDAAVTRSLNEAKADGLEYVQTNPGFRPRTGLLQRGTAGQVIRTSRGAIVRLQNRTPYAAAIDKGSRPHPIHARPGKRLRFTNKSGAVVFTSRVAHPGNKPYRFLSRATSAAADSFMRRIVPRMQAAARQF